MSVEMSANGTHKNVKICKRAINRILPDELNLSLIQEIFYITVNHPLTHFYSENSSHNPKVGGSNPTPATNDYSKLPRRCFPVVLKCDHICDQMVFVKQGLGWNFGENKIYFPI